MTEGDVERIPFASLELAVTYRRSSRVTSDAVETDIRRRGSVVRVKAQSNY